MTLVTWLRHAPAAPFCTTPTLVALPRADRRLGNGCASQGLPRASPPCTSQAWRGAAQPSSTATPGQGWAWPQGEQGPHRSVFWASPFLPGTGAGTCRLQVLLCSKCLHGSWRLACSVKMILLCVGVPVWANTGQKNIPGRGSKFPCPLCSIISPSQLLFSSVPPAWKERVDGTCEGPTRSWPCCCSPQGMQLW